MNQVIPEHMKKITEIFEGLSKGYHISNQDFNLYHELCEYEEQYREVFQKLGFELTVHEKGFYYFESRKSSLTANAKRMSLFIFFLTDLLANKGEDPYYNILHGDFNQESLIEDLVQGYAKEMKQAGYVDPERDFRNTLTQFKQYGFVSLSGSLFRFRPPISRFLDSCMVLGEQDSKEIDMWENEDGE